MSLLCIGLVHVCATSPLCRSAHNGACWSAPSFNSDLFQHQAVKAIKLGHAVIALAVQQASDHLLHVLAPLTSIGGSMDSSAEYMSLLPVGGQHWCSHGIQGDKDKGRLLHDWHRDHSAQGTERS